MTHQKRLPSPKHYPIERKEGKYVSTIEGSRSRENAIPAVILLRDVLEYAKNETEAKKIIQDRALIRNKKPITDIREGIGVLDVVEIPEAEEAYRVLREEKDLKFVPINDSEKIASKIIGKRSENQEYVYRLHNGENYRSSENFSTANTLMLKPSVEEIPLEEGVEAVIIKGKHAGKTGKIKEIKKRGIKKDIGTIQAEEEIETSLKNIVAVKDIQVEE